MIEDLQLVLNLGKSTEIKNKEYLSAKEYIQPFIDKVSVLHPTYKCEVKRAEQLSITNNIHDIVYNRMHVQAILPETFHTSHNNCKAVIGMVYGIDCKPAIAKFYTAAIMDGNLVTFDSNAISYQEIDEGMKLDYSKVNLNPYLKTTELMLDSLKNAVVDKTKMGTKLGEWIDFTLSNSLVTQGGKVKLSTSFPINLYKGLLKDNNSPFYVLPSEDLTMLKIYKAGISLISEDTDIVNVFEKTLLFNKMIGL